LRPSSDKKRQHHHVWQHYLQPWTVDGAIHFLMNGRIRSTGTPRVAVEKNFYKLHKLSTTDLQLIKALVIDVAHPIARPIHIDFVNKITAPMRFVEQNRQVMKNLDKIDAYLDVDMSNVLEDYHASIEKSFLPMLARLGNSDLSFYNDPNECITFLRFLATQYMRTKGIKIRTIQVVRDNYGHDLTRIWNIMSFMLAVDFGAALFEQRERRSVALVHNRTETTFITGDQPVIDLHAIRPDLVEKVSLYYPLGPRVALLLTDVDEAPQYATDTLTSAQVEALNKKIFENSHSQVFAQTKESLSGLTPDGQAA
jgi:Protein of unknown function (DUF4238)